jgi:hypothetical protein
MSVGTRRLAAAQRTAAGKPPSRARRLGAWIIIVPALALFSFSVVAGAAGFQPKPDVASAAAKVLPQGHDTGKPDQSKGNDGNHDQGNQGNQGHGDQHGNGGDEDDNGGLVLIGSSHDDGSIAGRLGKGGREVCWISTSQLARVSAVYRTTKTTIRIHRTTYKLVTVYGANEHNLKQLLASAVKCRLLEEHHLFFLPFDPNLS